MDNGPSGEGEEPLPGEGQGQSGTRVNPQGQSETPEVGKSEVKVTLPEGHIETQGSDVTTGDLGDPDDLEDPNQEELEDEDEEDMEEEEEAEEDTGENLF